MVVSSDKMVSGTVGVGGGGGGGGGGGTVTVCTGYSDMTPGMTEFLGL